MKLYHYAEEPFKVDLSWGYRNLETSFLENSPYSKPFGLWVSCEECDEIVNWRQWCLDSVFRIKSLVYRIPIRLRDNNKILVINGIDEFDMFQDRWGLFQKKCYENPCTLFSDDEYRFYMIDWKYFKHSYDGIIICPYLWKKRHASNWYYGWDCASGCIWNLNSIEFGEWEKTPEELLVVK